MLLSIAAVINGRVVRREYHNRRRGDIAVKGNKMSTITEALKKLGRDAGGDGRAILTQEVNGLVGPNWPAGIGNSVNLWLSFANGISKSFKGQSIDKVIEEARRFVKEQHKCAA